MADGAATISSLAGSGLSDAHTDTLHRIAEEVLDVVDSPELKEATVSRYINRGVLEIVAKLARRRVYLPSLLATAEVETAVNADAVSLPADYHANLHGALDMESGRFLVVRPWPVLQRMRQPGPLRSGAVTAVAVYGQRMRYWMIPDTPRRIAVQYHRLPVPLVATTDKPFEVPVELSTRILVDYAAGEAWSNLEQEMGDARVQTNDCRARVAEALDVLAMEIGPWPAEAAPITDAMDWGHAW